MIIIGIDAHKDTHTAVAVDEVGKQLAEVMVAARDGGHLRLLRWARRFEQRRFAVEDCRHLTRRLEGALLTAGEGVVRVPPHLMARARASSRQLGKSDPIDALSVARAAQREPDRPVAELDGPTREIKLLGDYRDALVRERTRLQNSLRWHLHELCPELEVRARGLKSFTVCRRSRPSLHVMRVWSPSSLVSTSTASWSSTTRSTTSSAGFVRWCMPSRRPCYRCPAWGC